MYTALPNAILNCSLICTIDNYQQTDAMSNPNPTRDELIVIKKTVALIVVVALAIWLIYQLRVILVSVFVAIILASAITPVAEAAERKRFPRVVTLIVIYLLVTLVYVLFAIALWPALKEQAIMLYTNLPNYLNSVTDQFNRFAQVAGGSAPTIDLPAMSQNFMYRAAGRTLDLTTGVMESIANFVLVLFLAAYFVIEAKNIWRQLLLWIPPAHRERCAALILPLEVRLGGYVRGQVLVSIAVGMFLGTGLTLLGVKYSLVLGMLSGLLNLVPFVGSILTAIFSIIVACNQSPLLGVATFLLFACEQWVESNFIVPHLVGRNTDLHPLIVLFAILIGATLMGLPGALIAVPAASALLFLAREFYLKPLNSAVVGTHEREEAEASTA